MKKLMLILAAAFAMVACQTDINEVGVVGGEVDVTFEVGTPTRAYSDGTTATVLQYAVYEGETELTALTRSVEDNNPDTINISKTVSFKLVTGNTYTVIFWAAAPNAPYTVDFANKTMTIDYTGVKSNNENLDAFYKRHTFTVNGAQTETIELRRPFAQLNIGTSDFEDAEKAGYTADQSFVKVTKLGDVLNLWNDKVEGTDAEITFNYAAIPTTETFPVAGYEYLAMNYLLVDSEKEVVDIEFGYNDTEVNDAKTRIVGSVPVQRNYRTNIYGQLLTSDVDINVEIKPEYNEPAHTADALFLAAAFGGEVTLTEDVVLSAPLQVQTNMTINLNGKTITGTMHKSAGHVIVVNEGVALTLVGGKVESTAINGGSALYNRGVLVVDGTEVVGANGGDGSWPSYPINNYGSMTLKNVSVTGYQGAVACSAAGTTVLENCNITKEYFSTSSHVLYVNHNDAKVTINGGTYVHKGMDGSLAYINKGSVTVNAGEFSVSGGGYGMAPLSAGSLVINGGTFNTGLLNWGGSIVLNGGAFASNPNAAWLADGLKTIKSNGFYYVVDNTVEGVTAEVVVNPTGVSYTGEIFENTINDALYYKNWVLMGDATIKVEKTYGAIILENVSGNLNGNVIEINNDNNSVMVLQNCDFTLAEGKKLIKSTKTIYQVFMANITINGVKMTDATIAQYLENVGWFQVVEEI